MSDHLEPAHAALGMTKPPSAFEDLCVKVDKQGEQLRKLENELINLRETIEDRDVH